MKYSLNKVKRATWKSQLIFSTSSFASSSKKITLITVKKRTYKSCTSWNLISMTAKYTKDSKRYHHQLYIFRGKEIVCAVYNQAAELKGWKKRAHAKMWNLRKKRERERKKKRVREKIYSPLTYTSQRRKKWKDPFCKNDSLHFVLLFLNALNS